MTSEFQSARDDLAYMRSLVGGGGAHAAMGEVFFWAGLLYGGQCFAHWLQAQGLAPTEGLPALAIVAGPTLALIALMIGIGWRARKAGGGNAATRAMSVVFQAAGLANLVMALVFAYGAYKAQSLMVWLYHPVVVCMFQGMAWFTAYGVLRRGWLGLVAAGWFAVTALLGFLVEDGERFVLVLAVALLLLMALPGWVIWRGAKRAG